MFEAKEPNAGEFKYVQFSDHAIAPEKQSISTCTGVVTAKKNYIKS